MRGLIGVAALCAAGDAAAHAADGNAAWVTLPWSFEPWTIVSLALSLALYLLGIARLWRAAGIGRGIGRLQLAWFGAGWLGLAVALVSPLDPLGNRLFSAHMLQHELLMVLAAPLLVLGRPLAVWAWALAPPWRRRLGAVFRHAAWRVPWRLFTAPLAAWSVHATALWLWHMPVLFDAALHDDTVHAWQHASFLATALLFWWSVLGPRERRRVGVAIASLFTTMLHTGALGALLTLSPRMWYPAYAGTTAAFGLDALEDQQIGGLLMWLPAGAAYLATGLALAAPWLANKEAATMGHGGDSETARADGLSRQHLPIADR